VDNAAWTADNGVFTTAAGSQYMGTDRFGMPGSTTANVWNPVAHFTAPTLPNDRRFKLLLRMFQSTGPTATQIRARIVSGGCQVTGEPVSLPVEAYAANGFNGVDLGSFYFPPGSVGSIAGATTTVYIEALSTSTTFGFTQLDYALFVPEDSMVEFETEDSSKTLAAASGIVQAESIQLYDSTGAQLGGDITGAHLRCRGASRFMVHSSQGFRGAVASPFWTFEPVDVWFTYTPRYLHLAA
jgi:hypothetical protein